MRLSTTISKEHSFLTNELKFFFKLDSVPQQDSTMSYLIIHPVFLSGCVQVNACFCVCFLSRAWWWCQQSWRRWSPTSWRAESQACGWRSLTRASNRWEVTSVTSLTDSSSYRCGLFQNHMLKCKEFNKAIHLSLTSWCTCWVGKGKWQNLGIESVSASWQAVCLWKHTEF